MEGAPFNKAKQLIKEREYQPAIELLKQYAYGDTEIGLLHLENRLFGFQIDESSGRFSSEVMRNELNDISYNILKFTKILEIEQNRRKKLLEYSQNNLPLQNDRDLPPKEILLLRSKIILKMRNITGQKQRKAYQLEDWVNLKLDCQIVREQLSQCDWGDYEDRLEAYTLIKSMFEIFTEFLFGMKGTENESKEVYDLINCANPMLNQMLTDIKDANNGNSNKTIQLAYKQDSLAYRFEGIISELKSLIAKSEIN